LLVEKGLFGPLSNLVSNERLFVFPPYPSTSLKIIDLTFGLLLVALSEEFIFRICLIEWLESFSLGRISVTVISCFIFATIHWGHGSVNVVLVFVWALLPAYYYQKKKDIFPCVLAHYVTNFIIFLNY